MPRVDCPHCHTSLHTGLIYDAFDSCPRCGAPLHPPRPTVREQVRRFISRRPRTATDAADWEAITSSQYAERRRVSRPNGNGNGAPA